MTLTIKDVQVSQGEEINADFFNRRFSALVAAITELKFDADFINNTSNDLVALGIARVNESLGPLLAQISGAATLGFLIGGSSTTLTLLAGDEFDFVIGADSGRALFTPTPWLTAVDNNSGTHFANLSLVSYNSTTGALRVSVLSLSPGSSLTSSNWTISCTGGVLPVMQTLATAAQGNENAAAVSAAAAAADAATIADVVIAVQAGPVVRVAGKTGDVSLVISDIISLATALAAKANSADVAISLATYAPLNSPALIGNPTAPTQSPNNNSTRIATTAYADALVIALLNSPALTGTPTAPTQAGSDNSTRLATTAFIAAARAAGLISPAFTGNPTAPTQTALDNSTKLATTAYADAAIAAMLDQGTF